MTTKRKLVFWSAMGLMSFSAPFVNKAPWLVLGVTAVCASYLMFELISSAIRMYED